MEVIGVNEVMEIANCGRKSAIRLLSMKDCPTFPRSKNETYKTERTAFENWFLGKCMSKKGR